MLEPSCTTSGKSTQPENMMFTDHIASVLSNFHKMIGTADLEKKEFLSPKMTQAGPDVRNVKLGRFQVSLLAEAWKLEN